jgi:hypothetical protein
VEAAGIELYRCWGFIDLDRGGKTGVRNGQLLSLNVVKQRNVVVGNISESHVEKQGEMDYRSWHCIINHGKEKYRSFQKERETVIRG